MNILTLEILASIVSSIGVVLIAIPHISGMILLVVGQLLWGIFAYKLGKDWFLAQSIFMLVVNIIGVYMWNKKKVGK